jgi:sugar phosphate isomerase/epimerase
MQLGFKADGFLRKRGWKPGAGSDWDTVATVKELQYWRDQGFELVEFTADQRSATGEFFKFTSEEWKRTRAVIEEAGLKPHSILGWRRMISREPWVPEKLEDLERIARASDILGLRVIDVFVAYSQPLQPIIGGESRPQFRSLWDAAPQDFEISAARLKEYARRVAGFGASISIEMHPDSLSDTAVSALRLREMIDEPNVGINPDTVDNGWYYPGEPLPDAATQIKMVAPYVNHWHVKQFNRTIGADGKWVMTGARADEGSQPIDVMVRTLVQAGYKGAAIQECGRGADHAYNLKCFRDYLRWLLDEYVPNVPD